MFRSEGEMNYNLIYKNKETGEVKKFSRDQYRNYTSEDGFTMSKNESYQNWTFMGKSGPSARMSASADKKSAGLKVFEKARNMLDGMYHAQTIKHSTEMEHYINGFTSCLEIFEGKN
jgi:hypothetical protein